MNKTEFVKSFLKIRTLTMIIIVVKRHETLSQVEKSTLKEISISYEKLHILFQIAHRILEILYQKFRQLA